MLRITAGNAAPARVHVRKQSFAVGAPLSFDEEYTHLTALECALGAIGADVVGGLKAAAKRRRVKLDNIEATASGKFNNPLTYLAVVGEPGHLGIERVSVSVFVNSPGPKEAVRAVWDEALARSPLVHTFRSAVALDLAMKLVT
ncbi:MAG: OsmC family protein [SAR202 cluster bacterium]|nr:OsmC family protein [SAR202 cluster bacterium]